MKNLSLGIIVTLGLLCFPLAATGDLTTVEHRVSNSTLHETTPTLGNDGTQDLVVYTARELLDTGMFDQADIYYQPLVGGQAVGSPVQVTAGPTDDVLNDVSGDYIVYTAFDYTDALSGSIMLYRMSTGQLRALGDAGLVRDPKIHGDYVVWLQGGVPTEVILYDLTTNVSQSLAGPVPPAVEAQIGSRFVVWSSFDGDYDIEVFDFELNRRYAITATAFTHERYPTTAGDWIAWQARDIASPGGRIEAYNGRTGEMRIIIDDGAENRLPSLDDGLIAWDGRLNGMNGDWHVFVHRLDTSETFQVTSNSGDQYLNDLYGGLVAYVDQRSGDEDIYVSTLNFQPTANAGDDQAVHLGLVTLDGSGSSDPDEDYPLVYSWQIVSKPEGSGAVLSDSALVNASFTADVSGDYTVELVVTDSKGLESSSDTVSISTSNTAPIAAAGPDQAISVVGTTVTLDGNTSYDPHGDSFTYAWEITQKPSGSGAALSNPAIVNPTFMADINGTYVIQLIVTDIFGAGSDPDTVEVSFSNVNPVADAGGNQSVSVGDTVSLNGSGSSDANGDPLTYSWSIVSIPAGSTATLSNPTAVASTFVADRSGTYVVSLVVNDGLVDSDSANASITASDTQNEVVEKLQDLTTTINGLEPDVFKNPSMANALTNKINAVLGMIDQGLYLDALDKLENDVIRKTDGCANAGAPDKNDWIKTCVAQGQVYPLILDAMTLLEN